MKQLVFLVLAFLSFAFSKFEIIPHPGWVQSIPTKDSIVFDSPKMGQKIMFRMGYPFNRTWRPDQMLYLDSIIKRLLPLDTFTFTIEVHSDCRASKEYNRAYTQRIADSLTNYFVEKSNKMLAFRGIGKGESELVNDCKCEGDTLVPCSEVKHQENRRIILEITGKKTSQ